ncbi:hypothetical protein RYX36_036540 [Vicia faba]
MDVLNIGDMAFNWAKDQVLCLYPELDISLVDFFKNIVDGKLVDMEADEDDDDSLPTGVESDLRFVAKKVTAKEAQDMNQGVTQKGYT